MIKFTIIPKKAIWQLAICKTGALISLTNVNLNLHSFPPRNRLVLRKICRFHRYAFLWEDKLDHSFRNQFTNWYDSWISFCLSLPYKGYENSAALLCPSFDTRHWFISIQNQDQSYFGGHDFERNFTTTESMGMHVMEKQLMEFPALLKGKIVRHL